MFVIITRSFPPEIGGMQNLMKGLAVELSKYEMIKVFADYYDEHEKFDNNLSFSVERVAGIKLFRKYRKAYLVNEFIKNNKDLMKKINEIKEADIKDGGSGAFYIYLKKLSKK